MITIELNKELQSQNNTFKMDVSFSINEGDFVAIYGDSGAGKTTLLRLLAGLMVANSGKINTGNTCWYNSDEIICLTPQKRKVGMVFQDYALFPNMTVRQNLEFALQKNEPNDVIDELIDIFELTELQNQKSTSLSGGQKQRVALARALTQIPKMLLLDEPLSALDDKLRQKLQEFTRKFHDKHRMTTFIVTHDISEIFKLCNKVITIDNGKIIGEDTPEAKFLDSNSKGKYNVIGTVLAIRKIGEEKTASIISNQNIFEVLLQKEAKIPKIGDKVMVTAESFVLSIVKI